MDEIDREWLMDMLEQAKVAVLLLGAADAAQVERDTRTLYAVSHAVLIVREAAGRVSPQAQAEFPAIPGKSVTGMRHRLVHGYRSRSAAVLVDTVHEHLPPLIAILEDALGKKAQ